MQQFDLANAACDKCGLCKTRKSVVNGAGTVTAKIVIVAEAPGPEENEVGLPFQSAVGKQLVKMLNKANIGQIEVFFTYIVRCFPKDAPPVGFREPTWDEIQTCLPYFQQEVASIKPTVIVPMGNLALRAVLQDKKANITKYRGTETWSETYNCKIMPTFHPAAIMRTPKYEGITIQDFARIKQSSTYTELTPTKKGNYLVIDTLEKLNDMLERIKTVPALVFDIETNSLNWEKGQILCSAFSWQKGTGVVLPITRYVGRPIEIVKQKEKKVRRKVNGAWVSEIATVDVVETVIEDTYEPWWGDDQDKVVAALKEILSSDIPKITHNGKFDAKFFMQAGYTVNNLAFDTMLAHHLIDENAEGMHGLKDCAIIYTELGDYAKPIEDWFKEHGIIESKRNYAHLPPDMLYEYACMDADCTMQLYEIFSKLLAQDQLESLFYRLTMPLNANLLQAEFEGIMVDRDYMGSLQTDLKAEIDALSAQIKGLVGEINISSPVQLRELLFTQLKLPVIKKTPSNEASTDEETLSKLKDLHPVPNLLLEYRRVEKLYNTYACGLEELIDSIGRIHTTFLIHGTTTGRLSSRDPNLQNIPKDDKRIKNMFKAQDGWVFIEADYAQAEFRFWASYSGDLQMLEDLRNGLDIHRHTAANVLKKPFDQVTDEERGQAKRIVFGLMYGMGPKKLARQNNCTEQHALDVIAYFFSKYPTAKAWLQNTIKIAKRDGCVRSCFGRIRRLPAISHSDPILRSESERQAMNSPIQSAASDLTCNAANRIVYKLQELQYRGKLRLLIHDAIILEVPEEEAEATIQIMQGEMSRPVEGVIAPMTSDVKIGPRWGEMVKPEKYFKEKQNGHQNVSRVDALHSNLS